MISTQRSVETASTRRMDSVTQEMRKNSQDFRLVRAKMMAEPVKFAEGPEFEETVTAVTTKQKSVTTVRENLEAGEVLRDLTYVLGIGIKTKTHEAGPTLADFKSGLHGDYGQGAVDFEAEVPPESIDWVRFGAEILKTGCLTRFLGGANTVVGPMDCEPKARKVCAPRRVRRAPAEVVTPDQVADADKDEVKAHTDAIIDSMRKCLKRKSHRGGVPFANLVLNRNSFSQTVENVFAFSFLVRTGKVELTTADGRLMCVPALEPTKEEIENGSVENTQFALIYDMRDWKALMELVERGKELMPDRRIGGASMKNSNLPRAGSAKASQRQPMIPTARVTSAERPRIATRHVVEEANVEEEEEEGEEGEGEEGEGEGEAREEAGNGEEMENELPTRRRKSHDTVQKLDQEGPRRRKQKKR